MYYLSECLIIKNENQYLTEHLTENVRSGIEHFFIYDNYSDKPVSEFIAENIPHLADRCTVELFPTTRLTQVDCYAHFLSQHRDDTKWCAYIDTDEMLEGDLAKLCRDHEDILTLSLIQTMHGANGQAYADFSKTLTERFKSHILQRQFMCKCVAQTQYVQKQFPHHTDLKDAYKFPRSKWLKFFKDDNGICKLHHYYYRSFEEWLQKVNRGNVLSDFGDYVSRFFVENSIPDADRDYLLKKYGLTLNSRMTYNAN